MRRAALTAVSLALMVTTLGAAEPERPAAAAGGGLHEVMFVGNNWAGTISIVDAHTHKVLKRGVDLVPDKEQELADIRSNPADLAYYLAIQQGPGEGHDQYVDDMFTTNAGRYLAVSRPSFADVVWIDIAKAIAGEADAIVREQQMDGQRTDHMGLSPNGKRLLVSDSTERQVIEYSMVEQTLRSGRAITMGDRLRSFESGETPHENNYSADGKRVFHASIGKVYTPGDATGVGPVKIGPLHDALKGDRWFEIVRTSDFKVTRRWDMGKELAEAGHPDMSAAVRPMAIAPGERFIYFQVSYFHGIVEFDTRAKDVNGAVDYSTGTMDDYVALVDRSSTRHKIFDRASSGHDYLKPYWTTEGPDNTCWVSLSGSDAVAVIDFESKKEVAYLAVGDHPQRVRLGVITVDALTRD